MRELWLIRLFQVKGHLHPPALVPLSPLLIGPKAWVAICHVGSGGPAVPNCGLTSATLGTCLSRQGWLHQYRTLIRDPDSLSLQYCLG